MRIFSETTSIVQSSSRFNSCSYQSYILLGFKLIITVVERKLLLVYICKYIS
jgi:hypothetical protein